MLDGMQGPGPAGAVFSSQVDIGAAVGAVLATGVVFQANFRRVVRLVDRVFLRRRYATAELALRRRGGVRSAILLGRDGSGSAPDFDTVRGLSAVLGEMVVA